MTINSYESKNETNETGETTEKSVIIKALKCHINQTGLSVDLDTRKMVITAQGKYLITCSEIEEEEVPKVCIWSGEKFLQQVQKEEDILEGILSAEESETQNKRLANWLLCVDAITTQVNGKDIWIICAGSVNGDIYLWSGDIDSKSEDWNVIPSFFHNFSDSTETSKRAIFDIKIWEDKIKHTYNIYLISNNFGVISKDKTGDNYIKELCLNASLSQGKVQFERVYSRNFKPEQDEWILSFDLAIMKLCPNCNTILIRKSENFYCKECKKEFEPERAEEFKVIKKLVSGSNDNTITEWDLENGTEITEIKEIMSHENGITSIKVFDSGNKLASGCLDSVIKIWDLNTKEFLFDLPGHIKEIVSIDVQEDNEYLISASRDNTIKVWDLDIKVLVRNIKLDEEMAKYKESVHKKTQKKSEKDQQEEEQPDSVLKDVEHGLNFLRQVLYSPNDQMIFAIKKNKVLLLENYGRLWHFDQQLDFIKSKHNELYKTIYGENLKQLAKKKSENEESLKEVYEEIKKRLTDYTGRYNPWKLGDLFIPSFIKYEKDDETQKIYIESVRTNYDSYWESVKKMFHEIPNLSWEFKLFITTDKKEKIEETRFTEITHVNQNNMKRGKEKKDDNKTTIVLKDRNQSQLRFLLVLVRVPTTFIPLLKAITLDVEDDRGDKDKLMFTDFKRSWENFIEVFIDPKNPKAGGKKYTDVEDNFYYSYCTFKLDERYSTEKFADIFIRKKGIEFTESLNPLESKMYSKGDFKLFAAFRNNFLSPITPRTSVKIGKGLGSRIGKIMDNYLSGLIMLDFLFTILSILIVYRDYLPTTIVPFNMAILSLNMVVTVLIIIYAFTTGFRKKERRPKGKKSSQVRKSKVFGGV